MERNTGGDRFDEGRNVENQVSCVGALAQFVIDPAAQFQVLGINFISRRDLRAHRAEAILGFSQEPLLVVLLQVSSGHVVDDHVTPDMGIRVGASDTTTSRADDDTELGLVVDLLSHTRTPITGSPVAMTLEGALVKIIGASGASPGVGPEL